jgi:hypothetical protein
LEQGIKNLDGIVAAEAAKEAYNNSWGAWLLSPIYKKAEDSEAEKRKDRDRRERRIEREMKRRRLDLKKAELQKLESLLRKAKEEVEAADMVDNRKTQVIQDRIRDRNSDEARERDWREELERARLERQRLERERERDKQEFRDNSRSSEGDGSGKRQRCWGKNRRRSGQQSRSYKGNRPGRGKRY